MQVCMHQVVKTQINKRAWWQVLYDFHENQIARACLKHLPDEMHPKT